MEKKKKTELEVLNELKEKKINEVFEKLGKRKSISKIKKEKKIAEGIIIQVKESGTKSYLKKSSAGKKRIRKIIRLLTFGLFLLMAGVIWFLFEKYRNFQLYLSKNKEIMELGKRYEEEQKMKAEELKNLKDLTLENVKNVPEDKKNVMLNIIPSGSPLLRDIYITSPFGERVHPISGQRRFHHGIDLRVDIGDPVISSAIGRVSFTGVKGGYGNVVIIDHMYGFQTTYAHLNKILVKNGEIIGKGKVIAEGGNSGSSTGPHLHYEVRYNGTPIEPKNFIDWDSKNFNIIFEKERSVPWEYFLTIMGKN
ncbi:M23 family metallopeptidase [Leptotrichia sp. OH3620_COT-345]|uniref:M23 family metallopeptidase n=1 Tax=Leptotrichia sp. OH3620_COT-345 TaxID=2491048 RepID=UPI000F64F0C7|nr:M23 family metallopeptidase [Leptotrichia sp. OH3620_COT-345]RRD37931.1 M23 family metallopeptidase [Leptotrichia sp. OH3620_COT-345]